MAALEDARSALAALDALVVGNGDGKRTGGDGDHRRHPAVLRLLSQCPFPQLASYVASGGERKSSPSSARKSKGSSERGSGSSHCFPPAGGKSARGAASADRRLSEAALVLSCGAEAAERAARAAGDLASLPEEEVEALLVEALLVEEAGLGPGAAAGAAEAGDGGERDGSEDGDESPAAATAASRLRGLSLASAAPVSLAAVADAFELLARMRRAVASGEEEKKGEEEAEEQDTGAAPSASPSSPSPSSQPLPPAACPWSSPDHLHSYALFWELSPFVDERDVEVALAVERAARRKRRKKESEEK